MKKIFRCHPIGIQDFEDLRNSNCIYIDKTDFIYRIANTYTVYCLSRPRCFGKSLLVSTLVNVSAILYCRSFLVLISLQCIKTKNHGFKRKQIWKHLETFP